MNLRWMSSERKRRKSPSVRVFVRVTLTSVACMALALGCSGAAAQQPQNARGMGSSRLDGDWQNVDPQTRDLVEILIQGNKIHPYGACLPTACDWGVIKAKGFASSVDSADITRLVAKKTTGFDQAEITLSLEPDGRLRAELFTHFTDSSGRADYSTVNYYTRGRRPYIR
jgi:hypothetical protein